MSKPPYSVGDSLRHFLIAERVASTGGEVIFSGELSGFRVRTMTGGALKLSELSDCQQTPVPPLSHHMVAWPP